MDSTESGSNRIGARTRRNTMQLAGWTGAWLVSLAVAVFGPALVWESKLISVGAILVNVAAGIGMIIANKQHLQGLDELQRKIQLEGMAIALGVGLVGGPAYSTLNITNLIPVDAEISWLIVLMSFAYLGAILAGRRKYR